MRGEHMKGKWLIAGSFLFVFMMGIIPSLLYAQGPAKTFTLVYSNNLNAEIDPCPS
jgi:hypothetical protein